MCHLVVYEYIYSRRHIWTMDICRLVQVPPSLYVPLMDFLLTRASKKVSRLTRAEGVGDRLKRAEVMYAS